MFQSFETTSSPNDGPSRLSALRAEMGDAEAAVTAELANLLEAGFADEDVERVRNSLAADAIYARDSQQSMANLFGSWLAIGGDIEDLLSYPDDVRSVTTEQALAAVRKVFAEENHYIEAQLLPAEGEL